MAADLFADRDLAGVCPATRVEPAAYPFGLADFAASLTPTPWIYTGALENRPDLVDAIAARHRLLGNLGDVLRCVRDPIALARSLRVANLNAPDVRLVPSGLPTDGSWLVKPIASAGGHGIRPWTGGPIRPNSYFQRRVNGLPLSAIFVAERGSATLVGITRQFLDRSGFSYRGSLGPWPVADEVTARIGRIGFVLASAFGLVGGFGVDLILAEDRPWTIEVNPRYTASVEVLEWASGRSVLAKHLRACGEPIPYSPHPRSPGRFVAKAILRADRPSRWPDRDELGPFDLTLFPEVADVPHPGTSFVAGEPVLTAFASADSPAACRRQLAERLRSLRRQLILSG